MGVLKRVPVRGDKVLTRDGHVATVVTTVREDGVTFAWLTYDDGFMPYHDVGGRVAGTEENPVWEHRVKSGKVVRPGGDYWNREDWVMEKGLREVTA